MKNKIFLIMFLLILSTLNVKADMAIPPSYEFLGNNSLVITIGIILAIVLVISLIYLIIKKRKGCKK